MNKVKEFHKKKARRTLRVRAKISGTEERPRISVSRSNRFLFIQLIDDSKGGTIAAVSTKGIGGKEKITKIEQAFKAGEKIAELAIKKGIKAAVFDRRSYRYHGRVKAVADGARKAGLNL